MGGYRVDAQGRYWYVEDPIDEVEFAPYQRRTARPLDDFSWWRDDPDPLRHLPEPVTHEVGDVSRDAIESILAGETWEQWVARRTAEGKPTSPIEDGKQD